jgi:hypothetical protein
VKAEPFWIRILAKSQAVMGTKRSTGNGAEVCSISRIKSITTIDVSSRLSMRAGLIIISRIELVESIRDIR